MQMETGSVRLDFRRVVHRAIAQRRHELASHPAINEAFKDVRLERAPPVLRRQASSDAISRPKPSAVLQASRHELQTVYRDADEEARLFRQAVREYNLSDVPEHLKTGVIQNAAHTPEQALQAAKAVADEKYDVKGFRRNIVHKLNRFFTDNASVMLKWSEVLPSQNQYFSVICGGLKLIFGAAARLGKIREEICKAIEEIPSILNRTSNILRMFEAHQLPKESKLHEHNASIMAGVISLLHHIVYELSKKQSVFRRNMTCLLKQDKYGETLLLAIESLQSNVQQFERTADDFATGATLDTRDAALDTRENVMLLQKAMYQGREENQYLQMRTEQCITIFGRQQSEELHALYAEQKTQGASLSDFRNTVDNSQADVQQALLEMKSDLKSVRTELQKQKQQVRLQRVLPAFLESNERIDRRTGRLDEARDERARFYYEQHSRLQAEKRFDKMNDAFVRLDFDRFVVENDIRQELIRAPLLDLHTQDRAVALMIDPKLGEWLNSPDSAIIFINANCDPEECPTAYASAKLADSIRHVSGGIREELSDMYCLAYFCVDHTHYRDPDAGPCGLIRSWIAQLLLAHRTFDLHILREVDKIDPTDIESLCPVFELLIRSLGPETVLFCVLDGLFAFESRKNFAEDTTFLVDYMLELYESLKDDETQAVVKLWFSSNTGSRRLHQWLDRADMLVLPESIPTYGGLAQLEDALPSLLPS